MRVTSPVGEYEYRVRGVSLERGRVVVAGNLGVWETTMEIEPRDWLRLAVPAALVCSVAFAVRRALG